MKPDRVEVEFLHACAKLIARDDLVLVGCSGGGDSVALLHLLYRLSPRRRPGLIVAHLDHGLRRGSKADRSFVEKLGRALALTVVSDRREVASLRRKGESPEEAARRVRRAFLLDVARRHGASKVALGHTEDDQAETILMRLVRGAGPTALLGMRAAGPGPLVRPLLELSRVEIRRWLARHRFPFREDPSNRDLSFERNRVRLKVLPELRKLNPKAARHIAQGMARLREDADFLDALAREAFDAIAVRRGTGWAMDAKALRELPQALRGRVERLARL